MTHIKPQIPKELKDIVIDTNESVKLKNYSPNIDSYKSFHRYTTDKKSVNQFANDILENSRNSLINADEIFFASKKYALLVVLQGMDTAGKDGIISHVLSGVNPQSCKVSSFKVPTSLEHEHNFLWRYSKELPRHGEITIFNRSYYEDILVTKVHPECMETLPEEVALKNNKKFWNNRYEDINNFELHLARNGTVIIKFFLHISKDEQKNRLLERLTNEDKYWKISSSDFKERKFWEQYTKAYEEMLSNTSSEYAPWIIVPANDKKIARAIVAHSIASVINKLNIHYPEVSKDEINFFKTAKDDLLNEKP